MKDGLARRIGRQGMAMFLTFVKDSWWWVLVLGRVVCIGLLGGIVGGGFWYVAANEGLDIWEE